MKTQTVDFFHVEHHHQAIHARLENWARWVSVRMPSWVSPMFRMARSNGRQWHQPEIRPSCDILDAQAIEKAVSFLPDCHRAAVRWCYVYRNHPVKECKRLGLTRDEMARAIHEGRQMLVNRRS